jgi:mRNA interferase RelE/StbE
MQRRMNAAIDALASDPCGPGTRKLTGSDILCRLRVDTCRVVYEIRGDRLLILVVKIGHGRDIYR